MLRKSVLIALLVSQAAGAGEYTPFTLESVDIHYKRFAPGGRDPYFLTSEPSDEVNFNVRSTVLKYGFLNTRIQGMTDQSGQFHVGGLNYVIGLRLTPWLDVQCEHFSRHIFDQTYPYQGPGLENSLGVRVFIYGGEKRGEAVVE